MKRHTHQIHQLDIYIQSPIHTYLYIYTSSPPLGKQIANQENRRPAHNMTWYDKAKQSKPTPIKASQSIAWTIKKKGLGGRGVGIDIHIHIYMHIQSYTPRYGTVQSDKYSTVQYSTHCR